MTYRNYRLKDWLSHLSACHFKTIDLSLERISQVAERLGVLTFDCPVVMVAGTNGKGSTVGLTAAILSAAGYRVGTYTSPHLVEYNERVQINGKNVSDSALCQAFNRIEKLRLGIPLTYFEFGTLAAFLLFKKAGLDALILEVGLGGRLDAVNCIDADLSIISTIDLDHMEYLGFSREKIAQEKAGIMRQGKPCICGDFYLPRAIINKAKQLHCPLSRIGVDFNYTFYSTTWSWKNPFLSLSDLPLPCIDLQNAATVLQAIQPLSNWFSISPQAIEQGLKNVFLPGRFQVVEKNGRKIILDVAHNPSGAKCLARRLSRIPCAGKTYAIVGMLAKKDTVNTLNKLQAYIQYWYLCDLNVESDAGAERLEQSLEGSLSGQITKFFSPERAFKQAYHSMKIGDRIVVFGSFHTVSAVLNLI